MNEQEKREKVIQQLQEVITEATYPDRPRKFMMPLELAESALELLKAQEPVNCRDCIHYDRKNTVNGFAKCRNSLSQQYCSWLTETNGCDYIERR